MTPSILPRQAREERGNRYLSAGVVLFFLLLYLLPLGQRPISIPDETRYGEIPREMVASGEWVAPHLNSLRYFENPPWVTG